MLKGRFLISYRTESVCLHNSYGLLFIESKSNAQNGTLKFTATISVYMRLFFKSTSIKFIYSYISTYTVVCVKPVNYNAMNKWTHELKLPNWLRSAILKCVLFKLNSHFGKFRLKWKCIPFQTNYEQSYFDWMQKIPPNNEISSNLKQECIQIIWMRITFLSQGCTYANIWFESVFFLLQRHFLHNRYCLEFVSM